jgi:hypothetical protein
VRDFSKPLDKEHSSCKGKGGTAIGEPPVKQTIKVREPARREGQELAIGSSG